MYYCIYLWRKLPVLFKPPELDTEEREVIAKINEIRKSLRHTTATPSRWFGILRQATLARHIRHSNSIEGINVTRDDAMAAVENVEPMNAEKGMWQATVGYRNAMTYVLQLASDPHFSYSEGLIRSLHFMILQHDLARHPGRYRPGLVFVQDERRQRRLYEGPDAKIVPGLMEELISSLNEPDDHPSAKIKAAMGHLNLVMIHPFSDGNGRMARILQTLILAREQIIEAPFCSIEEYLGRYTDEYYDVLGRVGRGSWHPENDCRDWIRFILIAHYRQATWLVQRTRITERIWFEVEQLVNDKGLPERTTVPLVNAAFGYRIRNLSYQSSAFVSQQVASRELKLLVNEGLLVPDGEARARTYAASEGLRKIYLNSYEKRSEENPFQQPQPPFPNGPAK
jgi:Fic family protein